MDQAWFTQSFFREGTLREFTHRPVDSVQASETRQDLAHAGRERNPPLKMWLEQWRSTNASVEARKSGLAVAQSQSFDFSELGMKLPEL